MSHVHPSRTGLFLGLAFLASLQVLTGTLAFQHTRRLRDDAAWVAHTQEVLDAVQEFLTTVVDAETGQRGYLLTKNARYLQTYQAAAAAFRVRATRVKVLLQGDAREEERFRQIEVLLDAKLQELRWTIELVEKEPGMAQGVVQTHLGMNLMDAIRGEVEGIVRDEHALLSSRRRQSLRSYRVATVSGVGFALLGLLMTAGVLAKLLAHLRERKQFEEAKSLEALVVLAGGVAHDFNNLLTSIMGNANLASQKVEPEGKVARYLDAIEKAALRAADLTRQLLAYAGKGKYLVTPVNLNLVLQEVSLPGKVAIQWDLCDQLPLVLGDAAQLAQVIGNLLTNAEEACGEGGQGAVTVRTRLEHLDEAAILACPWVLPVVPGEYSTFEVHDPGAGMDSEVLARAFEPFFSTKFSGRGLGLAAVAGILRNHGGGLWARSEPGQGSTFKVFLPALPGPGLP